MSSLVFEIKKVKLIKAKSRIMVPGWVLAKGTWAVASQKTENSS
jgi:hypothetical protein